MTSDQTRNIERLDSAIKDNNEWFYDKPSSKSSIEALATYSAAYFKLVPRWIALNEAAIIARDVITQLSSTIHGQQQEIKRLRSILSDNNIEIEELEESK